MVTEIKKVIDVQDVKGSSNISGLGYDAESQTLAIRFQTGSVYHYTSVPQETFDSLMSADSKGKFFSSLIRGKFDYTKVA